MTFASFATHSKTMAEPTNPTTPDQILADVPGKWEKAKESGELLFFPSTERIVSGDFPVSAARAAGRSDAVNPRMPSFIKVLGFIVAQSNAIAFLLESVTANSPVPDPAVPRACAEANQQQGREEG